MSIEAAHDGNVLHLLPFSEEQALDDLRMLGKTRPKQCELAGRWQWHRKRVSRGLDRWSRQKLIRRNRGLITVLAAPGATPHPANDDSVPRPGAAPVQRTRPRLVPVAPADAPPSAASAPVRDPVPGRVPNSHKWLGGLAILLGVAFAMAGLGWSVLGLARGGHDTAAGWLIVAVCMGIDLLAVCGPSFATAIWTLGYRVFGLAIWTGYAAAIAFVIFNGVGVARMQIGDAVAGRAHTIQTSDDLRIELAERLKEQRSLRFLPVDPAQIETAEDKRDRLCERSPKSRDCEQRGDEVIALGKQRATNERLTAIDAEIKDIRGKLANSKALAGADPQVEAAVEMLNLPRRGVESFRIGGLVLIPMVMSGVLLGAGMLLRQGKT